MLKVDPKRKPVLFWDIDLNTFDASKYPEFAITRVLEHGSLEDIQWMFKNFQKDKIIDVVINTRNISKRSANFWSNILHIDKNQITCLNKILTPTLREF